MGLMVTLLVLFLLAVLPLGVGVRYNQSGLRVNVLAGPMRVLVFPRPKKEKSGDKKAKNTKQKDKKRKTSSGKSKTKATKVDASSQPSAKEKGGSITDFLPLVKVALELLDGFRRKIRVNRLELKIIMAADDPCDLAINYGKAWASLGNLMPMLERVLTIRKRDINIECDFTADITRIVAHADITITLGRLLALVVVCGIKGIAKYLSIMKKRKGGVAT